MKDTVQALPVVDAAALGLPDRSSALGNAVPEFFGPDPDFDGIAALAAGFVSAPVSIVSVFADQDQCFLARLGTSEIRMPLRGTFNASLMSHGGDALLVPDARVDPRFSNLETFGCTPKLLSYAGAPIMIDGQPVGSVVVGDVVAQAHWPDDLLQRLERLASLAASLIKLKEETRRRTLAAEAISRDEKRHALALDAANVASWLWDISTGLISGNDTFYRMFGVQPPRPLSARKFFMTVHGADRKLAIGRLRRALASGKEYDGLFRTAKSGRWLLGRGRVHERDANGKPTVFL
ncbi:GAF domain-containing protein, partial [Shinella sp.]